MKKEKVDKITDLLQKNLLLPMVNDNYTGKIVLNLQSGGLSGELELLHKVSLKDELRIKKDGIMR